MLPTTKNVTWERATEAQILQSLALLAGLPSRQTDDAQFDQDMFFVALEGVTRQSLSLAVKAVMQGKLGHPFFPTPPELRLQCDKAFEDQSRAFERERRWAEQQAENQRLAKIHETRTPEAIARQQASYQRFLATYDDGKQAAEDAERARVRAAYGMTEEVLAGLKNQPVPSNFEQVKYQAKSA